MNSINQTGKNLLFWGDSLIEFYDWQSAFPSHSIHNLGVAGETVAGLLGRVELLTTPHSSPSLQLIMIGTNNILMEDYSFLPSYEKIIDTIQSNNPAAELVINGLFPLRLPWLADNTISKLNTLLEELAHSKKIGYLDGYKIFNEQASNTDCFLEDGVHISSYGYQLWSEAITHLLR